MIMSVANQFLKVVMKIYYELSMLNLMEFLRITAFFEVMLLMNGLIAIS